MRKYVIERELPAIGESSNDQMRGAAQKSNAALAELAPRIQWVESYVTADKTFCIYSALRPKRRRSSFPRRVRASSRLRSAPLMIPETPATHSPDSSLGSIRPALE
jgi:hypothetical protein